jgi:N-acetylneuraminate synthase
MQLGNRPIGPGFPTYIIAEIGVNHGGDMELAEKMVSAAKTAGADAVKFQTFSAKALATASTPKVEYQKRTTDGPNTQLEMLEKLEFKREDHPRIIEYCKKVGIEFISTPYDIESAQFLDSLNVSCYKVASADIVDLPLHRTIAQTMRPSIVATGMATMEEIQDCLKEYGNTPASQVCLLHCVSNYPCSDFSLCLKAMQSLKEQFGTLVGFSDHSVDSFAASLSVALGASVIEKHFTLDKKLFGPDHQASATPEEFAVMVHAVRRAELVLGDGVKKCQAEESQMREVSRKSLVLTAHLAAGTIISEEHLTMKRPGTGIPAKQIGQIIGKKLRRDLPKDHLISLEDLA